MLIFDKSCKQEMLSVKQGQQYIYEYVDCGHVYQELCINVEGHQFFKTDSCYNDIKTGKPLDCYYRYDEDDEYVLAVVNLDGSIELK